MRAFLILAVLAAPVAVYAQDDAMQGPPMHGENPRGDMTLTREPASAPTARDDRPDREIVKPNGRLVVTVPESGGVTQLTLPPGEYVVRYHGEPGDHVRLTRGAVVALDKYGLNLVGAGARQPRYAPPSEDGEYMPEEQPYAYAPRRTTGSENDRFVLHLALGWQDSHSSFGFPGLVLGNNDFAVTLGFDFGITERLRWIAPLPLFAYRIGDRGRGKVELMPWGGVTNAGIGWNDIDGTVFSYGLGIGFDGRLWATHNQAWAFGVRAQTYGAISSTQARPDEKPDTFRTVLSSAYQLKSRWVNLSLGLGLAQNVLYQDVAPTWARNNPNFDFRLGIGSMQNFGPFPEPLVSFNLTPRFTLDFYGTIEWSLHDGRAADAAMFGFTWRI